MDKTENTDEAVKIDDSEQATTVDSADATEGEDTAKASDTADAADAADENGVDDANDAVETDTESEMAESSGADTKRTKKKMRTKLWITLGVVVVLIAAGGTGFWVWHAQPSFCSAICHSPMDPYVNDYLGDDATLCVVAHKDAGVVCIDCHEQDLGQQLTEAQLWLTGNFSDPPTVRRFATPEFCNRCHNDGNPDNGIDQAEIIASTENYQGSGRNPHDSHLGDIACYTCHSAHNESKLYCAQCHTNITQPESWR